MVGAASALVSPLTALGASQVTMSWRRRSSGTAAATCSSSAACSFTGTERLTQVSTGSTAASGMQHRNWATSSACSRKEKCWRRRGSSWVSSLPRCLRRVVCTSSTLRVSWRAVAATAAAPTGGADSALDSSIDSSSNKCSCSNDVERKWQ